MCVCRVVLLLRGRAQEEERRVDGDGVAYTYADFVGYYGSGEAPPNAPWLARSLVTRQRPSFKLALVANVLSVCSAAPLSCSVAPSCRLHPRRLKLLSLVHSSDFARSWCFCVHYDYVCGQSKATPGG